MRNKISRLRGLASLFLPREGETMAERLGHLLDTDPEFRAEFDRQIKARLRKQYGEALQELHVVMQNSEREREAVWKLLSKVQTSGLPAPEHIPALIELERITRQSGGTAYTDVERMVFGALTELAGKLDADDVAIPILLDFLREAFRYQRKYDNFAARRRDAVLEIAATIAARTGDKGALALLHEALTHSTPKIRSLAAVIVYDTYEWSGYDMPAELVDRFWRMAEADRGKKVRQTALAVLQRLGLISHEEAMARLEGTG